jgi:hypothetical protein
MVRVVVPNSLDEADKCARARLHSSHSQFASSPLASLHHHVHLIARKLELEHRSLGEGERRCVVVYKKGCAPPPAVAKEGTNGEGGGAKTQAANSQIGNGMSHTPSCKQPHSASRLLPNCDVRVRVSARLGGRSAGGGAKTQAANSQIGNGMSGDGLARIYPPRRVSLGASREAT